MKWLMIPAALLIVAAASSKAKPVKLPKGPGQMLVQTKCATCHALTVVTSARKTKDQWEASLDQMVSRGAQLSDDEFDTVSAYLAKNYGVKK